MYIKVSKLSVKSVTETNSGKLITIVSGDIQSVERMMKFVPQVFSGPIINLVAYIVIWFLNDWVSSLITFVVGVFIMYCQIKSTTSIKELQGKESKFSDERIKLVNDMVIGARTIKSYGWENHYISKIVKERANQMKVLFKKSLLS
jgi:ABC-type multidrug transport system fused ATPase/permease subunit